MMNNINGQPISDIMRLRMNKETLKNFDGVSSGQINTNISMNNDPVDVAIFRTIKRLGLSEYPLKTHSIHGARVINLAISIDRYKFNKPQRLEFAYKELLNQLDNLSAKGTLVGHHSIGSGFEIIESYSDFNSKMIICVRPLILLKDLKYAKSLYLYIDEGSEVKELEE